MRRHLYLQIYVAFLMVALLCAAAAGVSVHALNDGAPTGFRDALAETLAATLPQHAGPELDQRIRRLSGQLDVDVAVLAPDGTQLATTRPGLLPPTTDHDHWQHQAARAWSFRLPDGRRVIAASRSAPAHVRQLWLTLLSVLIAAAIGCFPIARRITRRLERLQRSVDRAGAGDLSVRVPVRGRDEVAQLAASFNRALTRIEQLVSAQRRVLASASHELRSPMTRLRMAVELLAEDQPQDAEARRKLLRDCASDIEELDHLVDDVLLSARLEGETSTRPLTPLDVTALAQLEAERVGAHVMGSAHNVLGDERMLPRLLRNLFENAQRHGGAEAIEATVQREGEMVLIRICDRGPGVPAQDQERIFEPFYRPQGHREGADGGVGLGLALVRQIATHHGGNVRYRDREGGGSCFEVRLPAHVTAK